MVLPFLLPRFWARVNYRDLQRDECPSCRHLDVLHSRAELRNTIFSAIGQVLPFKPPRSYQSHWEIIIPSYFLFSVIFVVTIHFLWTLLITPDLKSATAMLDTKSRSANRHDSRPDERSLSNIRLHDITYFAIQSS